jgi:multimeric flavodoxin WrbA
MKVIAINGSPRRNFNTAKLCQSLLDGAKSVGAEVELIHLEQYKFKGCMSCLGCHLKKNRYNIHCLYKDELNDILNKCLEADVIVIGSPIYYGFVTGDVRAFMERLMFPLDTYILEEDGTRPVKTPKVIPTALIYTMNAAENNKKTLHINERELKRIFGYSETYYAYDTCQFKNYDLYDASLFNKEHKQEQLEKQFPIDLKNCFDLGIKLVNKAKELNEDVK